MHVVPKEVWEARGKLDEWALDVVDRTEKDVAEANLESIRDGDYPVVYNQLKRAMTDEHQFEGIDQHLEIASECLDHLGLSIQYMRN